MKNLNKKNFVIDIVKIATKKASYQDARGFLYPLI